MSRRAVVISVALAALLAGLAGAAPLQNIPISVQVVDAGGQPITGGRAYLGGEPVGETVKAGWAQAVRAKVTPGIQYVTYARAGLLAARRIRVRDNDPSVTAIVRLGAEPVAEGRVVASDGRPVAQAAMSTFLVPTSFTSDAQGRFAIDGFCLDETKVTAGLPGYVQSEPARISEPFPTSMRLTVLREGTIGLTVSDTAGNPIRDARCGVCMMVAGSRQIQWAGPGGWTDGEGKTRPVEVHPGNARAVAYAPGYAPQLQRLHVNEGGRLDLHFSLKPLPTVPVSGVVVGPDGRTPVANARVTLRSEVESAKNVLLMLTGQEVGGFAGYDPGVSYGASTDGDGAFQLWMALGRYDLVEASAPGYVADRLPVLIEVTGPVSGLRFQLFRGGRVQGTVRMPDGSSPPEGTSARLNLRVGESVGKSWEIPVDPETGRFAFERAHPGTAELVVRFPDGATATAKFEVEEGRVAEPALKLVPGPPEARIIGKVVDRRDGTPIAMAVVRATQESGPDRTAITEDDGTFEFPALRGGKITVTVSLPRYSTVSDLVDASDGGLQEVTLKTSPGGRVEGEVAAVLLQSAAAPIQVSLRLGKDWAAGTSPDETGHFVLTHIVPGSYTVDSGPGAKPQEITVAEGRAARVVLEPR